MIILLCFVRVFTRNINIKCISFVLTCTTNDKINLVVCACVCYKVCFIMLLVVVGGFLCLWQYDKLSMIILYIFPCVRTHGTVGTPLHLHAISTYFLVNQLLVHITVQRIGVTYRVQCISPEDLLRLYSRIYVLSIK